MAPAYPEEVKVPLKEVVYNRTTVEEFFAEDTNVNKPKDSFLLYLAAFGGKKI